MKKRKYVLFVGILCIFLLVSCQRQADSNGSDDVSDKPSPSQGIAGGATVFFEISSPDEAFLFLSDRYDESVWTSGLSTDSSVPTGSSQEVISFLIGVRSANALLAALTDELDSAKVIANSISSAADRIGLNSDDLEVLASELEDALNMNDGPEKSRKVRSLLNRMYNTVNSSLTSTQAYFQAMLTKLGAWTEGIRLAMAVINTNYDNDVATALLAREAEANYFLGFLTAHQTDNGIAQSVLPLMVDLVNAMDLASSGELTEGLSQQILTVTEAIQDTIL